MSLPQILFFDFDNTVVDSETHEVPQSTQNALRELTDKGYKVAIASGRNYVNLKETGACEMVDWSGYILNNGQVILDAEEATLVHRTLPHESLLKIIELADKLGFNLFFSSPSGDFLHRPPNDFLYEAHDFFREPIPEVDVYTHQPIDKVLVYAHKGYDYAPFKDIPGIAVFPSVSTYCDIATYGINKASSIKEFLKLNDLPETYTAFGDSMNDWEMITEATIGVAMGNGDPRLKAQAKWVADTVSNDGIAKMLKQLGYLD